MLVPIVGGFTYWVVYGPSVGVPQVSFDIKPITDDIFDNTDNMFVFFLDDPEDVLNRKEDFTRVIKALASEESLSHLKYFYNIKDEKDPPVGLPGAEAAPEGEAGQSAPMKCVMYRGQRKSVLTIDGEVAKQEVVDFFKPVSEELSDELRALDIPRLNWASFTQEVIESSSPARPVLVQMYEDTCFLCFLMRPFINALGVLFKEHNVPLRIKRYNVERNDFPDGSPVVRGTPTFVFFVGKDAPGVKWDEFKPKDLAEKLSHEFPNLPEGVLDRMEELQALVSRRFQLFTQLVMWTVELNKLVEKVSTPIGTAVAPGGNDHMEDQDFNAVVQKMMTKDMARTDLIEENIAHLQREVDEVEHDAVLMGTMLAEAVIKREKEEDALFQR